MTVADEDRQDADVPTQAIEALTAAEQRARLAGHTRVLVRDGKLIRIEGETVTVLKPIPARKKVLPRTSQPNR
jgi:hypothetical protein